MSKQPKINSIKLRSNGTILATKVVFADTFLTRLRGLMFRPPLAEGEALVIRPCNQVHMFFMSYPIDVIFCSAEFEVLRCYSNLKPWRLTALCHGAVNTIELASGTSEKFGVTPGDRLELV